MRQRAGGPFALLVARSPELEHDGGGAVGREAEGLRVAPCVGERAADVGVRLGLAISLMGLIIYGVASGQLGHRNPWDAGPAAAAEDARTE